MTENIMKLSKITEKILIKIRIKNTKRAMNKLFKGTTTIRSVGSFTSSKGKIINEKIAIVTSHTNKSKFTKGKKELGAFIKSKKKAWKQESVGVTIETPKHPSKTFIFVK